jgi:hypothetical protein
MDINDIKVALDAIEEIWPFKRIKAPQHLIDKYNETFKDKKYVDFAITVDKNAEVTDDELWDMMVDSNKMLENAIPLKFNDLKWVDAE